MSKKVICLIFCVSLQAAQADEDHSSVPTLEALLIDSKIQLDGRLEEGVWQRAPVATEFFQIQPREGESATERTEVRVLYHDQDLFIGVHCFDSSPQDIVAQKLQRDSGLDDDDMFGILFDTYHDHRNAYYFATNPNGVEEDGQIVDGAFSKNLDWDGVWEVKARITANGWTAELKIPLWNLRFNGAARQSWGVNFTRIIKRKTEQVNWASWSRNNGGFLRISRAGDLLNLNGLRSGLNLQVKPYTLGRINRGNLLRANSTGKESFDGGLDVKYGITSNLTLDLTYNTDFAQVEADVEQINLTRFPLFFPEKREFFLESASTFQFGQPGFFGPPPLLLFFSRRIGIEGIQTLTPIIAGGRLTGKVGRFDLGLIDVVTEEKNGFPKTHFSVARISRDLFQRSRVGLIVTNRANVGQDQNRAYGIDANIWLSNVLEFQSFFAQTHAAGSGNTDRAWKLGLDFTKDHLGGFASHLFIDQNFDPALGFVLRRNIRQTTLAFRVSPQPNGKFLRRTDIRQNLVHILNKDGELTDWTYGLSFNNELSSGDFITLQYSHIFVSLPDTFRFRSDIRIAPADFGNNQVSASFQSSAKRKVTASANMGWREFFSGELFNWGAGVAYVPSPHFSVAFEYGRNEVRLPEGKLNTDLFELRMNLMFTTRLFLNGLMQYNSETNDFSTNLRLNFIHSAGSDLFLVFNEERGRPGATFFDGLPARNREFILKFTQLLRI
ncbi:MAG: DUF5916 domain-containing protein [bacterium]